MQHDERDHAFEVSSAELRRWAARAADFAAAWLNRETCDPVLNFASGRELEAALDTEPPVAGSDFETVFAEFEDHIARYCRANGHPRYFAYVSASADPAGMIAELLAAAMNQNVTAWRSSPGAATVERRVVSWLDQMVGFKGGHGVLTGGGSAANFNALAMAIVRAEGRGVERRDMVVYLSEDTHFSLVKAARVLGVPPGNVRALPLDAGRRMQLPALKAAIHADREARRHPLLVCASAGTANCGAIDPIEDIAAVAGDSGAWLHVDGAYGAPAASTGSHAWLRDAFARADSLSIDPHKWLYTPLDAGCLLYRDPAVARDAFAESAAYTAVTQTDPVEAHAFFDHGMELSRRFRALKLWFALKLRGTAAFARAIERNIAIREHLDRRLAADAGMERLASGLSISCFRIVKKGADLESLNALNARVLDRLLASGRFLLSPTALDGAFALRVCIVNFRTTEQDIDALLQAIREAAAEG